MKNYIIILLLLISLGNNTKAQIMSPYPAPVELILNGYLEKDSLINGVSYLETDSMGAYILWEDTIYEPDLGYYYEYKKHIYLGIFLENHSYIDGLQMVEKSLLNKNKIPQEILEIIFKAYMTYSAEEEYDWVTTLIIEID